MNKPILLIDFDGVLHQYTSGWKGEDNIPDPPVPGALRWLLKASEYFDVQIYSSRSRTPAGIRAMIIWLRGHAVREWGDPDRAEKFMDMMKFPVLKPPAFLTIDDRAICFNGDFESPTLNPTALLKFKPWNKR